MTSYPAVCFPDFLTDIVNYKSNTDIDVDELRSYPR